MIVLIDKDVPMRKLLLAVLLAEIFSSCVSFSTYAGSPDAPPRTSSGFGVSITGFYLQPSASNLDYAVYTEPLPVTTPDWTQKYLKPKYNATFDVALLYAFNGGINEIDLDWLYFNRSTSDSTSASGTASVAPPYYFGPGAQALIGTGADGKVQFTLNDVSLAYKRLIHIGNYIQLAPFVGLDITSFKQYLTANFSGSDVNTGTPYSITTYNNSTFLGVGPRLGLDFKGLVYCHFSIVARAAVSLLTGSIASKTNFLSFGAGNSRSAATKLADDTQTRTLTEFDSKLGMNYEIPFKSSGGSLSFEAGYLFAVYMDVVNQVMPTSLVPNAFNGGVIAIQTDAQVQSNFGLNGPYLKLTLIF